MSVPLPKIVRNKEIMLRALEGQTPEEIAAFYDLEPESISNILASPLVKDHMERLQQELAKDIVTKVKARSHEALETMTDVMRGEVTSELRFKASKDLLDRTPEFRPQQDSGLKELGAGMGEYIIRELAKKRQQQEEPIDVGPSSGTEGKGEQVSLVSSESLGDSERNLP